MINIQFIQINFILKKNYRSFDIFILFYFLWLIQKTIEAYIYLIKDFEIFLIFS